MSTPRPAQPSTPLSWGQHAWSIHIVIGLAVAFAVHRKGRIVSIRWILEPLFGDRFKLRESDGHREVLGRLGDAVDFVAIVGTLFGVARGSVLSGLFLILILVFFIASPDSASFVVDMPASGGNPNPPVLSRVFWALTEGAIAAILLWVGARNGALTDGLSALQTMAIWWLRHSASSWC